MTASVRVSWRRFRKGAHLKGDGDDAEALFPLDAILPSQYYDRRLSSIRDEGVHSLLAAILEDAVRTFQSICSAKTLTRRSQIAMHEAELWIFDNSDSRPLSYVNVCDGLGLNPDALREGLLAWRRRCADQGSLKKLPRRAGVRVEGRIKAQRKRDSRH
jgi:hypothetical protein